MKPSIQSLSSFRLLPLCVLLPLVGVTLAQQATSLEPGTAPKYWFENATAADGSVQTAMVFRSVPGVRYAVESTHDLTNWTELDSFYGMGHEFATPMRQFTPPPPPAPNAPLAAAWGDVRIVSLRMSPSSGTAGGTVVSWASLDDGTARMVLLEDAVLDQRWVDMPYFAERYGAYYFFVGHPLASIPPPLENPVLGPLDTAMIATLETSLADMNQRVADAIARARNAPPPPPPNPFSKKFWRIRADWGLDSDGDGSPDWAEYATATANPLGVAGLRGDAFDADTDRNGILDGEQLDFDGDFRADAFDVSLLDAATNFAIGPVPRYALFVIKNAASSSSPDGQRSLQISDRGTVLFRHGTWTAGAWRTLALNSNTLGGASAIGINDHDVILGLARPNKTAEGLPTTLGDGHPEVFCYWPGPAAPPAWIQAQINDGGTMRPVLAVSEGGGHSPGPVLSNDGQFLGYATGRWLNGMAATFTPCIWTLPVGLPPTGDPTPIGDQLATAVESDVMFHIQSPGLTWGESLFDESGTGVIRGAGTLPTLPFVPQNVAVMPHGAVIAMPASSGGALAYYQGGWHRNSVFARATDISRDGFAIGQSHDELAAPVLLNGRWVDITETVPSQSAGKSEWRTDSTTLVDTTPGGWILASRPPDDDPDVLRTTSAVMLPIIANGVDATVTPPDRTSQEAGVDSISMTALNGNGKRSEIWLMAPNGGGTNSVRIRAPLNDQSSLQLMSSPTVAFPADALKLPDQTIEFRGLDTATSSHRPVLKLGGVQAADNTPIGVLAMKPRTVKVALHVVTGRFNGLSDTIPKHVPTEAVMEAELNKVYGRQTNTRFDVTIIPETAPGGGGIDFDNDPATPHDFKLNVDTVVSGFGENQQWTVGSELTLATPNAQADATPATANIDVWVVAGVRLILNGKSVYGAHFGKKFAGKVVIDGDLMGDSDPDPQVLLLRFCHVLEHEIGHVMVGPGHPDEGGGQAVLKWSDKPLSEQNSSGDWRDRLRLMCSGGGADLKHPGKQLVKAEWELIEAWLNAHVKDDE